MTDATAGVVARFLAKVDQTGDCWLWTAARQPRGYGWFHYEGRGRQAHRIAYQLFIGDIPDGLHIDHLCRTPQCVNPAHLEAVAPRENAMRGISPMAQQAKRTQCPQGHLYDEANTYWWRGKRACRTCRADFHRDHPRPGRRRSRRSTQKD